MVHLRDLILVLTSLALALAACGGQRPPGTVTDSDTGPRPTPIPAPPPGEGFSRLAGTIVKRPQWYEGQQVTLVGYFRGQDLVDKVVLDAPTDRFRDWVIEDDTGAVYVSYQKLLPFPPTSHEIWRIVRVSGKVVVHDNGTPYIVPSAVEWEGAKMDFDALPANCVFAIHRLGGADQLDHHIYWYDIRNLAVHDAKEDWRGAVRLSQGPSYDLDRAFAGAKFFALPTTIGQEPNCSGL